LAKEMDDAGLRDDEGAGHGGLAAPALVDVGLRESVKQALGQATGAGAEAVGLVHD
jgi:hypothetical protein